MRRNWPSGLGPSDRDDCVCGARGDGGQGARGTAIRIALVKVLAEAGDRDRALGDLAAHLLFGELLSRCRLVKRTEEVRIPA